MRNQSSFLKSLVNGFNGAMLRLRSSRLLGPRIRQHITVVSYVGRRSGRRFSTPVAYRRDGDTVTISVSLPDAKSWWRNFTGDGGPLTLELDGVDRTGHAVAHRDEQGRCTVTVRLGE